MIRVAALLTVCAIVNSSAALSQTLRDDELKQFCTTLSDTVADVRAQAQKKELEELALELEQQLAVIEEKRTGLQRWVEQRNAFAAAASEALVDMFSNMRADAAAERMQEMPVQLTAAIIIKLKSRQAASILNEMDAKDAAAVVQIMSASADIEISSAEADGDG